MAASRNHSAALAIVIAMMLAGCEPNSTGAPDASKPPGGSGARTLAPDAPITGAGLPPLPEWAQPLLGKARTAAFPGGGTEEACLGYVDQLAEYYANNSGARYEGWAWSRTQSKPYARLIATDAADTIRGAKIGIVDRDDVPGAFPGVITDKAVGYQLVAAISQGPIRVYGVSADALSTCLVGEFGK